MEGELHRGKPVAELAAVVGQVGDRAGDAQVPADFASGEHMVVVAGGVLTVGEHRVQIRLEPGRFVLGRIIEAHYDGVGLDGAELGEDVLECLADFAFGFGLRPDDEAAGAPVALALPHELGEVELVDVVESLDRRHLDAAENVEFNPGLALDGVARLVVRTGRRSDAGRLDAGGPSGHRRPLQLCRVADVAAEVQELLEVAGADGVEDAEVSHHPRPLREQDARDGSVPESVVAQDDLLHAREPRLVAGAADVRCEQGDLLVESSTSAGTGSQVEQATANGLDGEQAGGLGSDHSVAVGVVHEAGGDGDRAVGSEAGLEEREGGVRRFEREQPAEFVAPLGVGEDLGDHGWVGCELEPRDAG